jgi:hypothetical protein
MKRHLRKVNYTASYDRVKTAHGCKDAAGVYRYIVIEMPGFIIHLKPLAA